MSNIKQNQFRVIREQVLKEIRPTPAEIEGIHLVAEKLGASIRKHAQAAGVPVNFFEIEGSTGLKQTQLRNTSDIDAFVGLPESYVLPEGRTKKRENHKELEQLFANMVTTWLTAAVKDAGATSVTISYAEHPYLSAKLGTYDLDVILCVDIPETELLTHGPITAMDRTPWHSRYLDRSLTPDQKDDVRLLKQFFKACHAYGDASAPGQIGFIGYASELLVEHLGSFMEVLEAFPKLPQQVFDPFGRSVAQLRKIPRFQKDHLLIIDPTDRNRNVAAAISVRAYLWVNARVKEFLVKPSPDFFRVIPIPETTECPPEFRVIEFQVKGNVHYTVIRDKLYSWATSTQKKSCLENGREPRFQGTTFELYFQPNMPTYAVAFWTETPQISADFLRQGPAIGKSGSFNAENREPPDVKKFLAKHPNAIKRDGFYWTNQKRDFTDFTEFLTEQLREHPLTEFLDVKNLPHLTPTMPIGRQALFVLRKMVLPFEIR
ncbi:MAG: tRNA nucleotidyltransferase CCA-adding enzyme [Promethearchaeota archaeon CR_4]|nr:MAG: tRNA nucleotidyltransferase CCA-adding enzyme [Candidatus Lokiarchaeota archaeon CR_4]